MQDWYLANFGADDVGPALQLLRANALQRSRNLMMNIPSLQPADQAVVANIHFVVELEKVKSISQFASPDKSQLLEAGSYIEALADLIEGTETGMSSNDSSGRVYQRNPEVKGPMHAFDFSYIEDKLGVESVSGLALQGAVAYEALNLVDGKRTASEIRNWLIAEFAPAIYPIPLADVEAYLSALESIGVIR